MFLAPLLLVLINVNLSFELSNFKAKFMQKFAVMRRVPKAPSLQRAFAMLFKRPGL